MPSSAYIKMAIRTGYFFNVDSLLFSPFSEPVMLWSLVTITQAQYNLFRSFKVHQLMLSSGGSFCPIYYFMLQLDVKR